MTSRSLLRGTEAYQLVSDLNGEADIVVSHIIAVMNRNASRRAWIDFNPFQFFGTTSNKSESIVSPNNYSRNIRHIAT